MKFKSSKNLFNKTGVYCITNIINNKIYVGSTSVGFRQRYSQHKWDYESNKGNIPILHKAFDKYGYNNFEFSILCVCSKEDCVKMEQFYIDKGTDYNSCLIAGSLLGLKHSKNSKTRTVTGGDHHCSKEVYQFTKEGQFIKKHTSIIEACKSTNIKSKSNIVQCCKGNTYTAGGFRWSYTNKPVERPNRKGKHKILLQKDSFSKEFDSQLSAAEFLINKGFKANQGRINRSITVTGEKVYGYTVIKIN